MKHASQLIALSLTLSSLSFADAAKVIFEDNFERTESQEKTDEVGNGWGTNSAKRAAGNKQVDLKNGAMYVYIHEAADHAVSVTHPAEFQNGRVELRFMLENPEDSLGLNFADLKFKEVHAGHLCMTRISTKYVEISDLKTGVMNLEVYNAKKANKLTPEQKKALATTKKRFKNQLETKTWYNLMASISGDTLTVTIDGKKVGSFSSPGIAHPTKRMLRLNVPKQAVVDDLKIYAAE